MKTDTNRKTWSEPKVLSVEPMQNAAGGHGPFAKGPVTAEFQFNGPGS